MSISGIILAIVVLGFLIVFHELGHFCVARVFGMGVKTFSLGFGPRLVGIKRGKTEYQIAAVPLGGYVSLVGQDPGEELPEGFTSKEEFSTRPTWQRFLVILAGPVFNALLAWFIYWGMFVANGQIILMPVAGAVQAGSPAAIAGVMPGDRFLSINGAAVETWGEIPDLVQAGGGAPLNLVLERQAKEVTLTVKPQQQPGKSIFGEDITRWVIGVEYSGAYEQIPLGFFASASTGFVECANTTKLIVQSLVKLAQGAVPLDSVGGPISIVKLVSDQAAHGLSRVLMLAAFISVNLFLLNLLPIPVLDGGHILFLCLEMVSGRKVPERVQEITTSAGFFLLLLLMGLVIFNDIIRLATGAEF